MKQKKKQDDLITYNLNMYKWSSKNECNKNYICNSYVRQEGDYKVFKKYQ